MDHRKLEGLPLFRALGNERDASESARSPMRWTSARARRCFTRATSRTSSWSCSRVSAEVVRDSESVAELGPGDFLGEVAALSNGQRNATVVARSPMRVAVMTDRDMRHIAREMPDVDTQLRQAAREHCPIPD